MSGTEQTTRLNVSETEEELIEQAQLAVSRCNWVVGECAGKWTVKYAKGRTDADFANLVGLSPDQVYQRRRVWETFGDIYSEYSHLRWSHFYVALNWDDASECLQWADENQTTVKEMRAWRRALHGEDLTTDPEPEFEAMPSDPTIGYVPTENSQVRTPDDAPAGKERQSSGKEGVSTAESEQGETAAPYAPYRKNAGTPAPGEETAELTAAETASGSEQALKRMLISLERMNQELTTQRIAVLKDSPQEFRTRFVKALSELNQKIAGVL